MAVLRFWFSFIAGTVTVISPTSYSSPSQTMSLVLGPIDTTPLALPNVSLLEFQPDVVDSTSSPQTAEYTSAKHALAEDCTALQLIDQDLEDCRMRIARLHAQMRLLEFQRDVVQRRISIHRARLSPLRSVPDQVLQEIFRHCLPDTSYIVPDACSAPLLLTHVCRRWRAVAQGTSELWSSIKLYDRGVWNYELEVEMVRQWVNRSRMRPICMSITCPPRTDFGPDRDVSCSDIFQIAMAHSAHLRNLCLNVNKTYLRHFLVDANLRALQSIVISLHSIHRIDEPVEVNMPAFVFAPNLRRVAFKGNGTSTNLIPRTIFPQITHFSLDCNRTLDLALLFRDFSNLERLTLTLSHDALRLQFPSQRDHRIVAPSLLCLEVCLDRDVLDFGHPETLETLLGLLELPALHMFVISAPLRPRYDDARTGRTEARWENYAEWVRSSSVVSLLSHSGRVPRPQFECRDLVRDEVQYLVFEHST